MTKRVIWLVTVALAVVLLPTLAAAQVELVVWHAYRGKERAAFDQVVDMFNGDHVDDYSVKALAVPYDDGAPQCRVCVIRVDLVYQVSHAPAQPPGRVRDRVAGVVGEQPELVVAANLAIVREIVHDVGPARHARCGAVNENDRNPAGAVGFETREPIALDRQVALDQPLQLARPGVGFGQHVGQ